MKILKPTLTQPVEVIHHLADIHIRNDPSRHKEYRQVFKKLFASLKKETRPSLTVVCGDIVHNKTVLRPECIRLVKYFFVELAKISDVVVILGNHDCNINNATRLDSLSPIITKNFDTEHKIFLLTDDKTYRYQNLILGVTSIYSPQVTPCRTQKAGTKIALYHGMLKGITLDNDYQLTNQECFTRKDFADYDLVLLGDIHKQQYLNKKKTIAYSSSLVQQNHGESLLDHGYLRWEVESLTSEFVRIPNQYGFVTATLKESGLTLPPQMPAIPRIRLIYSGVTRAQVMESEQQLKEEYPKAEIISYQDVEAVNLSFSFGDANLEKNNSAEYRLQEIKNQNVVQDMIRDFLRSRQLEEPQIVQLMQEIAQLSQQIQYQFITETQRIHLENLEFSNLFSYGSDNQVPFSKMSQIVGVVAKNGHGKSSIIDSLLYSIYGKYSRGEKYQAVNLSQSQATSKIKLRINDRPLEIERRIHCTGIKSRRNRYEIKVTQDGKTVTEDEKNMTSRWLEEAICPYEDLVNTSIILQYGNNFLDLDPGKKKEYLCRLWGLDVISLLMKKARFQTNSLRQTILQYEKDYQKYQSQQLGPQLKELEKQLTTQKRLRKKNQQQQEKQIYQMDRLQKKMVRLGVHEYSEREYRQRTQEWETLQQKEVQIQKQRNKQEKKIHRQEDQLAQIQRSVEEQERIEQAYQAWSQVRTTQLDQWTQEKEQIMRDLQRVDQKLLASQPKVEKKIQSLEKKLIKLKQQEEKWSGLELPNPDESLEQEYDEYQKKSTQLQQWNQEADQLQGQLHQIQDQLHQLQTHRYNPKCEACLANPLTQQKTHLQEQEQEVEQKLEAKQKKIRLRNKKLRKQEGLETRYQEYTQGLTQREEQEQQLQQLNLQRKEKENELKHQQAQETRIQEMLQIQQANQEGEQRLAELQKSIQQLSQETHSEYEEEQVRQKQEQSLRQTLQQLQQEGQSLQHQAEKIQLEKKPLAEKYQLLQQQHDTMTQDSLGQKQQELQTLEVTLKAEQDQLQGEIERLVGEIGTLQQKVEEEKQVKEKISQLTQQKDLDDQIAKLLDKNGLMDHLLKSKILPQLQRQVNQILSFVADFSLIVHHDHSGIKISKDVDGKKLDSSALCGFERFIANISFRLAFNQINGRVKTDFLIIDEGFSCCDEENTGRLKALFDFIRRHYRWCLVITHLDEIKNNFDRMMQIERRGGLSQIVG